MTHILNYHVFLHITFLMLGIVACTISWLAHLFYFCLLVAFKQHFSIIIPQLYFASFSKKIVPGKNAKTPKHFLSYRHLENYISSLLFICIYNLFKMANIIKINKHIKELFFTLSFSFPKICIFYVNKGKLWLPVPH